jgi:hypothetical protein
MFAHKKIDGRAGYVGGPLPVHIPMHPAVTVSGQKIFSA